MADDPRDENLDAPDPAPSVGDASDGAGRAEDGAAPGRSGPTARAEGVAFDRGLVDESPREGVPAPSRDQAGSGSGRTPGVRQAQRRSSVRLPRHLQDRLPLHVGARREIVGLAVLGVLAVVCIALVVAVLQKTRDDAAAAAREAAAYTPPPLASASPAPSGPLIAVISDETATRAGSSVSTQERWPQLLEAELDAQVVVRSSTGAGYATDGSDGSSFGDLASGVPVDARVVLFVGGGADSSSSSLAVAKAATTAFSAAAEQAPDASLIAVGPFFKADGATASEDSALRAALQSSARIADVKWVDPQRSKWLDGVDSTSGLTVAAERTIAGRIRTAVGSAAG